MVLERQYAWSDGPMVDPKIWTTRPYWEAGSVLCGLLHHDGDVTGVECSGQHPYICQADLGMPFIYVALTFVY